MSGEKQLSCWVLLYAVDKYYVIYLTFFGVEIIMALFPTPPHAHKERKKVKRKSTNKQHLKIDFIRSQSAILVYLYHNEAWSKRAERQHPYIERGKDSSEDSSHWIIAFKIIQGNWSAETDPRPPGCKFSGSTGEASTSVSTHIWTSATCPSNLRLILTEVIGITISWRLSYLHVVWNNKLYIISDEQWKWKPLKFVLSTGSLDPPWTYDFDFGVHSGPLTSSAVGTC